MGILIFGGTTEGRMAATVCEEAGKPFYYSTKGNEQQMDMHNGIRICGAMTCNEIKDFCSTHDIECIIDAAHPFAEALHQEIALVGLPVIRIDRTHSQEDPDITYCSSYAEAIEKMEKVGIKHLLALSGANTIAKLKPYWQNHPTLFRILKREESLALAQKHGLAIENIIFYNEELSLPSMDSERKLFASLHCDAIITKESGTSGGFEAKVQAAKELGIAVFCIKAPTLPYDWTYVTGKYGLRRAIEHLVPNFFPLKTGFTTGACATAATKAAIISLLTDELPEEVCFALPDGEIMSIPVECHEPGKASVIKDFSDDPDVTKGCKITSEVSIAQQNCEEQVRFLQGEGVGTVTLPGLGIPVGEPAINPTPRQMIEAEIRELSDQHFDVRISVENGAELAQRTFNHKVGVVGGISIIGTSGIVKPLSNEAFVQSIRRELEVAKAIGCTEIGLVAGMKNERELQRRYPTLRCVHYGNFIGEALKAADALHFTKVTLALMIGKAVKLAEGHLDTHSHKVQMNREFLSSLAPEYAPQIASITMARSLWTFMPQSFFDNITMLCHKHCKSVFPNGEIEIILVCDKEQ